MYDEIAREINAAANHRGKAVMIHYLILMNADRLRDVRPEEFCDKVGIERTWAIEFRKMLNLARFLKDRGISLIPS